MAMKRQPLEIWRITRARIFARDGGVCQSPLAAPICRGKAGELTLETCNIDHIHSGRLGTNADSNLRVVCPSCHALRLDQRHRGMISSALRRGLIPVNWRQHCWE